MKARRHDPGARDRASARRASREHMQAAMTPAEIEALMCKVIREKITTGESIQRSDFVQAGVPELSISGRFRACLQRVQNDIAMEA